MVPTAKLPFCHQYVAGDPPAPQGSYNARVMTPRTASRLSSAAAGDPHIEGPDTVHQYRPLLLTAEPALTNLTGSPSLGISIEHPNVVSYVTSHTWNAPKS